MKRLKLTTAVFAVAFLAACTGNSQNEMAMNHQKPTTNMMEMKNGASQTIRLEKGELFLVISSVTKPGAENLMNEYFGKVFPIATKNGFKPLATLPIDKVVSGDYKPNNFTGLYSWPNMMAVEAFLKELPNSELTPMRKKIWEELKQVIVGVSEDVEFTLYDNKIYEVQTIWSDMPIDEAKNTSLIERNKGRVVLSFPVTGYEDLNSGKAPSQVILIEWESEKNATKYRTKKSKYMIEESFLTHLKIPEKK